MSRETLNLVEISALDSRSNFDKIDKIGIGKKKSMTNKYSPKIQILLLDRVNTTVRFAVLYAFEWYLR